MRILIIGHSVVDYINSADEKQKKPGGIYFSTVGLTAFKTENDIITLLSSIDEEHGELFRDAYSKIDSSLIQNAKLLPKVHLNVEGNKERCEAYENITEKLNIDKNYFSGEYDGILINMITGFDINLDDLKIIRENFRGPIYFDVHSLSRGLDTNYKRFFRTIPQIEDWLANITILHANKNELKSIIDTDDEKVAAEFVLSRGPEIIVITKGSQGASVYFNEDNILKNIHVNSIKIGSVNHVGCGDVFGSAFFYFYILTNKIDESLKFANTAAGVFTSYSTHDEFKKLKEDVSKRFD